MQERRESPEFEEVDAEDTAPDLETDLEAVDVDYILRDVDTRKRRASKGQEPTWRRLERVMEDRRTDELISDFEDYKIGVSIPVLRKKAR